MAWTFDGTGDYLRSPLNGCAPCNVTGAFTVSCWVFVDTTPGDGVYYNIFDVNGNFTGLGPGRLAVFGEGVSTSLRFGIFRDYTTTDNNYRTSAGLSIGAWHHVVWNDDGSSGPPVIWVDGVSQSLTTVTNGAGTVVAGADSVTIGNNYVATGGIDGQLGELAAWSRTLSQGEVDSLFAGFAPDWLRRGLIFYADLRGSNQIDQVSGAILTLAGNATPAAHPPKVIPFPGMRGRSKAAAAAAAGRIYKLAGYGGGLVGEARGLAA